MQGEVLQAVIAHDHISVRVGREQGAGGGDAARGNKDRYDGPRGKTLRNQSGFIAHLAGGAVGRDGSAVSGAAPIPAGDHSGAQSSGLQVPHQRNHHRGFASAPGNHVAHHHDGAAWVF
ncbi:hypothetical protein D3C71_1702630 [compost metagenome]